MKALGIVSEYNPFHNGHRFQIKNAKEQSGADVAIAVMSGNYVQRGDVAVYSKHERARLAVLGGADIVFELPAVFSLRSALPFAEASVFLLSAAGCDFIAFGAESDNINTLTSAADLFISEPEPFKNVLRENLNSGMSFAAARASAAAKINPQLAAITDSPNNILAISYIMALKKLKYNASPIITLRRGAAHDDDKAHGDFASASFIRRKLILGENASNFMPNVSKERPVSLADFEGIIIYALCTSSREFISSIADSSDGLSVRLFSSRAQTLPELLNEVKTKRLALSRIKRVLLNILIKNNISLECKPSYLRVLALNPVGAEYLKQLKKHTPLPIITKPAAYKDDDLIWESELTASEIRNIITHGKSDLMLSPIFIK